ncbi:hypothetical protein [Litoreibacter roseus]|nr:hypothetical protein [Litoreibacter roseus]
MTAGRPKRLKLEERIALSRRYHAGETAKVLAAAYGVSRRHVTRIAKEEQGEGQEVRDPSVAVSFRAAGSEIAAFDREWQARGFATRSTALRAVVRARCGLLDLMHERFQDFADLLRRTQDVSEAGRVLAKAVQRGKLQLGSEERATLAALLDLADKTHRELAALKTTAHERRRTGWGPDCPQDAKDVSRTAPGASLDETINGHADCSTLPSDGAEAPVSRSAFEVTYRSAGDV